LFKLPNAAFFGINFLRFQPPGMHRFFFIVICFVFFRLDAQHNSGPYTDSKLIRLQTFSPNIHHALESFEVTFMSCRHHVHSSAPELIVNDEVLQWLDEQHIDYTILESNVKDKIDREQEQIRSKRSNRSGLAWYETYRSYDEVQDKLNDIAAASSIASLINLGSSYENRSIWGLKLSTGNEEKPTVFFNACQHAREWITVMASMYLADHLVQNYQTDHFIQNLLNHVNVFIVPIVNPDGYVYTHTTDRYWRKNRQLNSSSSCVGTDLNRNWDADWNGGESTSTNACSDVYVGAAPFSATESDVLKGFMDSIPLLKAHVDIHSYAGLVLGPWGYSNEPSPDHDDVVELGEAMRDAFQNTHDYPYTFGTGDADGSIYLASGTMPDWSYDSLGAMGFTYELRPQTWGEGGFDLPTSKILDACEENYQAALQMMLWVARDALGCTDSSALNFDETATLDDGSCTYPLAQDTQRLNFPQGWSIFSTYIQPQMNDLDLLLAPISEKVIIAKNGVGDAYLPQYQYNGIGVLVDGEAYQLKLTASDALTIVGARIYPESFDLILSEGWNMMAYLKETPADADGVLQAINSDIYIVKSSDGSVYYPDVDYNGIGDLKPGQGYQIKLKRPVTFRYNSD